MYKLSKIITSRNTVQLLNNILTYHQLQMFIDNNLCRWWKMKNSVTQRSVLAPILFNLLMSDLPKTDGINFQFVDDMG